MWYNESYDEFEEENIKDIKYLYELRHAVNIFGIKKIVEELKKDIEWVNDLYTSSIHGSVSLIPFFKINGKRFQKLIEKSEQESLERRLNIAETRYKNACLIIDLKEKRKLFAGIGTNKAKRRLNKLASTDPVSKAVRLALETEDKSISAKNSYGQYREKIYEQKTQLIMELCELFKEQNWIYGIQKSNNPSASHVIYFEIPLCEQISWHFTPDKDDLFPIYVNEWDKKQNSTLEKLEKLTIKLIGEKK